MRYTDQDVLDALGCAIVRSGSLRRYAEQVGLSAAFVSQVMRGERPPSSSIANALGYTEDGKRWVRASK